MQICTFLVRFVYMILSSIFLPICFTRYSFSRTVLLLSFDARYARHSVYALFFVWGLLSHVFFGYLSLSSNSSVVFCLNNKIWRG